MCQECPLAYGYTEDFQEAVKRLFRHLPDVKDEIATLLGGPINERLGEYLFAPPRPPFEFCAGHQQNWLDWLEHIRAIWLKQWRWNQLLMQAVRRNYVKTLQAYSRPSGYLNWRARVDHKPQPLRKRNVRTTRRLRSGKLTAKGSGLIRQHLRQHLVNVTLSYNPPIGYLKWHNRMEYGVYRIASKWYDWHPNRFQKRMRAHAVNYRLARA